MIYVQNLFFQSTSNYCSFFSFLGASLVPDKYAEMGVKGLTTFIERQHDMLSEVQLHDTKVIIDGYGCMFYLYSSHLDRGHHGGEYEAYEDKCRLFITNLQKCNISPYFVFDGAYDLDDKKLTTLRDRCKERIRSAGTIADGRPSAFLLPPLADHVLRKVLTDLAVPFAVCDFEADNELVALANAWNCPVLGRDSDFFVMDIKAGYVLLEMLDWSHVRKKQNKAKASSRGRSKPDGSRTPSEVIYFLSAIKYTLTKFCKFFQVKRELLPLLATLTGNDYVDPFCFNQFMNQVYLRRKTKSSTSKKSGHFYSVLDWLADQESIDGCMEKILKPIKADQRAKVCNILEKSLMMYLPSNTSDLTRYFDEKFISSCQSFSDAKISVPRWCLTAMRNSDLPSTILNVLCTLRVFMGVKVDNPVMTTSNEASLWIRQVMYGILLRDVFESCAKQSDKLSGEAFVRKKEHQTPELVIIEYDRKARHLKCNEIDPVYDIPNFGKVLKLQDIPSTDESTRCKMLLATLAVNTIGSNNLPLCFHLPMFTVMYWIAHADPKANINHLRALLLCWVRNFAKHSQKDNPTSSTCKDPSWDLGEAEAQAVLRNFWINVESETLKRSPLNVEACHGFSQFQGCLKSTFHLNAALQYPFPAPDVTMLYSGKMVHCLYAIMQGIPGKHKPI